MESERIALIKVENVLWDQISVIDLNHYKIIHQCAAEISLDVNPNQPSLLLSFNYPSKTHLRAHLTLTVDSMASSTNVRLGCNLASGKYSG